MEYYQGSHLNWNNHRNELQNSLHTLWQRESLVDCTLASAEGKFIKAHKVILSACSSYFETLLQEQYDKHPIFILKDVGYQELRALLDFIYCGEVNVLEEELPSLLRVGGLLQIKGFLTPFSAESVMEEATQKVLMDSNCISGKKPRKKAKKNKQKPCDDIRNAIIDAQNSSCNSWQYAPHTPPIEHVAHRNAASESNIEDQSIENIILTDLNETKKQLAADVSDTIDLFEPKTELTEGNQLEQVLIESDVEYNAGAEESIKENTGSDSLLVIQEDASKSNDPMRPVPCKSGCGKTYRTTKNMLDHFRTGCGREKLFECAACNRQFTRKYVLKRHFSKVHQLKNVNKKVLDQTSNAIEL